MQATNTPLGISGLLVSSLLNENDDSESSNDTDDDNRKSRRGRNRSRGGRNRSRDSDLSRESGSRSRSRSAPRGAEEKRPEADDPTAPPTSTMDSETVDLFRYDLVSPVNLSHGHSALVSIFDSVVQGRKVALYNPTLHKHHPFSTLVMSNTTGLSLEAGSVTVFDGDMYIGEAHLIATKANERRFLPFSLEQGVMIQSQPFVTSLQPVHSFKVERCSITFSRKSVKIYHYVISNKSEKTTELLLEHPKEWDKPVGSVSLIVEECYHGTDKEKEKNKIDVKTEYVTGNNTSGSYGLNFVIPPRSTTHLVLHSQFVDRNSETLSLQKDFNYFKRTLGGEGPLLSQLNTIFRKVLTPYWNLDNQVAAIEGRVKTEKEQMVELESSQARARSNLNSLREHDKQRRYAEQLDKLEDEINQADARMKELNSQLRVNKDKLKATGDSLHFDSSVHSSTQK